ncbi:Alpha/Beta hydrolase protein [Mycena metata]|uniref:Alpha/Beta hydrolase protein n=1 Tax=Mycena metata TaxID=1033252 RepID=A0AAD7KCP2_9AGAR|nr:Alpha/Beta hydrolase protein [Mycena metata]
MSLCADCFKGVRHEGTPEGKIEHIGGVKCYVATPTVDYPKDKVVLFLTDGFGLSLPNNQLLADDFAQNGFKTIIPDILNGDECPADIFEPNRTGPAWDLKTWFASHGTEQTRPVIDKVVAALKADGVIGFAASGYCFGGRYVFDIAFDGITKASAVSHPSLLVSPDDLEKYSKLAKAPLLINSCVDEQFPLEAQVKADEILGNDKFAPGYHREFFEGLTHGFAVRGDMSDPKVKAGKERAFKMIVDWFLKHL